MASGGRVRRRASPEAAGGGVEMDALRYIERRDRTVAEVRRHLRGRGHTQAAVTAAIQKLARLGYLDDKALASRFAARAAAEKPMGRCRLERELARRGMDRDTIGRTLDETFGAEQEAAALDSALRKAARRGSGPVDEKRRRSVAAFLLRRGFASGQVRSAVQAWAGRMDMEAAEEVFEEPEKE